MQNIANGNMSQPVLETHTLPLCERKITKLIEFFIYHFGLLLLEGTEALPPAHNTTLCLHKITTDVMETLLLLGGPEHKESTKFCSVKPEEKKHSDRF